MPPKQLVSLLAGSKANHADQVRVAAAIGAMIQPVTWAWVDLDSAKARAELIEAAVAVFHGPRASASETRPRESALHPRRSAPPQ